MQEYYSIELLKMAAEASIAGTDVPQLSVDWSSTDAEIFESVVPALYVSCVNNMQDWRAAILLICLNWYDTSKVGCSTEYTIIWPLDYSSTIVEGKVAGNGTGSMTLKSGSETYLS